MIEVFRLVGVAVSFATLTTLTFQAGANYGLRGLDYTVRMVCLALLMAVLTFASVASLVRHLPAQDYHVYYTCAVTLFWLSLLTPWRWRLRP